MGSSVLRVVRGSFGALPRAQLHVGFQVELKFRRGYSRAEFFFSIFFF